MAPGFVAVISLSISTKIVLFVDKKPNSLVVSTRTHLSVDGAWNDSYAPPTNAKVATLILTLSGNMLRRAQKQACKVLPVVKTLYNNNIRIVGIIFYLCKGYRIT